MKSFISKIGMHWRVGALLLGAVALSYANALSNQFLFDDEFLLQKNSLLRSWENIFKIFQNSSTGGAGGADSFYRPMQTLAYLLTYQVAGLSEPAFHILNILLHLGNAMLMYLLARFLRLEGWFAAAPALLWAVHPLHTEAVTYMSATADPLHTLFCLLSGYIFTKASGPRRWIGSLMALTLALLTKETAVVLPILIMAVEYFRIATIKTKSPLAKQLGHVIKVSLPFWTLVAFYLFARMTVLNFDETFKFYRDSNIYTENILYRIYTFFATLPNYLQLLIWPQDLRMERNFPVFVDFFSWPVISGFLIFCSLIGSLFSGLRQKNGWAVLIPLWFLDAHIPHAGVLLPVNSLFLEHWMYLPSIGLFWGVGYGLQKLSGGFSFLRNRHGLPVLIPALLIAATLGYLTHQQNKTWSDPTTFYNHILSHEEGNLRVHNNLGMAYADAGRWSPAIRHYQKAISIEPTSPNPRHNLGLVYLRQGSIQQGIAALESAVEKNPDFYHSYFYLAQAYSAMGDSVKAQENERKYRETRAKFP